MTDKILSAEELAELIKDQCFDEGDGANIIEIGSFNTARAENLIKQRDQQQFELGRASQVCPSCGFRPKKDDRIFHEASINPYDPCIHKATAKDKQ